MQRAANLNRRLAFRRTKFTPPRKSPQFAAAHLQFDLDCRTTRRTRRSVAFSSVYATAIWPNRTLYRPSSRSVKGANDYYIINSICSKWIRGGNTVRCSKYYGHVNGVVILVASSSQSSTQSTTCPVCLFCLMVICDVAIIPCGHCLCCTWHVTSSEHHFNCYRMCTLFCMQNWHYWHHTSPFLDDSVV